MIKHCSAFCLILKYPFAPQILLLVKKQLRIALLFLSFPSFLFLSFLLHYRHLSFCLILKYPFAPSNSSPCKETVGVFVFSFLSFSLSLSLFFSTTDCLPSYLLLSLSLFSLKTERRGERCSERERELEERKQRKREPQTELWEKLRKNGFFQGINRSFFIKKIIDYSSVFLCWF